MHRYITPSALEVPPHEELDDMSRADLVFYDVEHSGPSYEGRVFINNPDASEETALDLEEGYAGSFTVFGHAGCYGDDESHCHPRAGYRDEFDHRLPPPLVPFTKTVIVTEGLQRAGSSEITVTVVPIVPEVEGGTEPKDVMKFGSLRLLIYEDPGQDSTTGAERSPRTRSAR